MRQPPPKREQAAPLLSLVEILPYVQDTTPTIQTLHHAICLSNLTHASSVYLQNTMAHKKLCL